MKTISYFLEDIRKEGYRAPLSPEDGASVDKYLEQMAHGPADGEMDIDWKSQGLGYYIHEHILHDMTDESERNRYLQKLNKDIETWLLKVPDHYLVKQVQKTLFEV